MSQQTTRAELVTEVKRLLDMGYTRFADSASYQGGGKSVHEHFASKLSDPNKLTKREVKNWFKMEELKGLRPKGILKGAQTQFVILNSDTENDSASPVTESTSVEETVTDEVAGEPVAEESFL